MDNNRLAIRNSCFELLRIVAMLFIILSHASVHGGYTLDSIPFSINRFWLESSSLGNLGTDIFIFISGYFLCERKVTVESFAKILSQVWFYSLTLFFVCWIGFESEISVMVVLKAFFPTVFAEYWFFTAYIILLFISPMLNIAINNMSRNQLKGLILALSLVWIIIPTFTRQDMYSYQMEQFMLFYLIGSYFRKWPENILKEKGVRIALTMLSFLLLFSSTLMIGLLEKQFPILQGHGDLFYDRNSVLTVGCALGLFCFAVYQKPFANKIVNLLGGCMFGVYLIHDNPLLREVIWRRWFNNTAYIYSNELIIRIIGSVLIIFCVSSVTEYIRQKIFEKPITDVVVKTLSVFVHKIKNTFKGF